MLICNTFFAVSIFSIFTKRKKMSKISDFFLGQYIMPHSIFLHTVPLKSPGIFRSAIFCSSIFLIYAYFENTAKEFYRSRRIRQKYFIVFDDCAKSLYAYAERTAIFRGVYLYGVVSKYTKSILACTLKAYKRIRRIC
jgi:hypothetical protein